MNRTHTACYFLIASAMVLSGLLIVEIGRKTPANEANAELVIARDNFTILTAETRSDEESLFVLDNTTGTLLIYRLDISSRELELANGLPLDEVFSQNNGRDRDRTNRERDRRR